MDTKLLSQVRDIFKIFPKYWKEDELQRRLVIEDLRKYDVLLISALLKNERINELYSIQAGNMTIFKQEEFIDLLRFKEYWANSYTKYSNEIGLTSEGKYLSYNSDVILDFPYKDCVLEGGMTQESSREEIYYNEVLGRDEIDVLLAPKVFTNSKKYTKDGAEEVNSFSEKDNLIIKGNNLLALHSLKERYREGIKLIFIDPPYNTGSDSFKYNDRFNHSTWLTFMKNRLEIAKELMTDDGSIALYIDNNEIGYLQVLMDEIFGRENRGGIISIKRGSVTGHKAINPGLVNITEFIIIYSKDKNYWKPNKIYKARSRNERYNNFIKNRDKNTEEWEICSLLSAFAEYKGLDKNKVKKELGKNFEKEIMQFIVQNSDAVIQFAFPDVDKIGKETKDLINISKNNPDKVFIQNRVNELDIVLKNGQRMLFYKDRLMEIGGKMTTVELVSDFWDDVLPNDLHGEGNVTFKKGKKSEKAIKRVLELLTNQGENDIVLDFFMGSGSVPASAHKLGLQYIGVEQMDYIENISIERLVNVIQDFDRKGISKTVNWHGGGSFVYSEIMELNISFIKKIQTTTTSDELKLLLEDIKDKAYLDYKVNLDKLTTEAIEVEGLDEKVAFSDLDIEVQKEILIKSLDKNRLYVNYSEIDDISYNISENDKTFNRSFYKDRGGN